MQRLTWRARRDGIRYSIHGNHHPSTINRHGYHHILLAQDSAEHANVLCRPCTHHALRVRYGSLQYVPQNFCPESWLAIQKLWNVSLSEETMRYVMSLNTEHACRYLHEKNTLQHAPAPTKKHKWQSSHCAEIIRGMRKALRHTLADCDSNTVILLRRKNAKGAHGKRLLRWQCQYTFCVTAFEETMEQAYQGISMKHREEGSAGGDHDRGYEKQIKAHAEEVQKEVLHVQTSIHVLLERKLVVD